MSSLSLYDTTLRDGTQGEGVSFTLEDKLKIVRKLDDFGLDFIEGGWPGSNPKDEEFFREVRKMKLRNSEVVAFSSTKRPGIRIEDDKNIAKLTSSGVKTVTIFGKSWDLHVTDALEISLEENLVLISDTINYLKKQGLRIFYDAEHFFDGYLHNPKYALQTLAAAKDAGAEALILCDTNGGVLSSQLRTIMQDVKKEIKAPLGIHTHDDGGLALANTLAAFEEGIVQIQGTIGGLGERCGNADLCNIIPALQSKYGIDFPTIKHGALTSLYYFIMEVANLIPESKKPYVGKSAFTHKAGIHVSAIQKNPHTYEHINPELYGNKRRVLVSELSGRSNLRFKLKELGFDLNEFGKKEFRHLTDTIKTMEHQGYQFEGAEGSLKILVQREFKNYRPFFQVEDFKIITHNFAEETSSEAVIKLTVNSQQVHIAAAGDGPVNALDNALRKALYSFYPCLDGMKLIDYKVRVLNGNDGTAAQVRVLIESSDGKNTWTTVGVSTNIIQASWKALLDSIEYGLLLQPQYEMAKRAIE